MPIANDVSTGGRDTEVDREILAPAAAATAAGRGAPTTPTPGPTSSSIIGPQRSNFVPSADISRGLHLVNDIPAPPPLMGPVIAQGAGREPGDADRVLGLAAVTDLREQQVQDAGRKRIRSQGDHLRGPDHPKNRSDHENPAMRSPYGPERAGGLLRERQGKVIENIQQRLGDLGMFAGAATTVPEVEQAEQTGSTGVPAWDDAIERAMNPGRTTSQEPSYGAGARAGSSIRLDPEQQAEEAEVEAAADRGRDRRTTRNALGGRQKRTDALTSEEYEALTPKQRAAVDLNTLLVTAVREDLAARRGKKDNPNAGGKQYDARVAEVFGEKGAAAAPYAPRTMELLDNVDFQVEGSNLNDVLKLKVGLNAEDIADIGREQSGPDASLMTPEKRRDDLTDALVSSFRQARRDPQRGATLLETQRDLLNTREAIDFGNPETNQMIDGVFEMLANPNSEIPADKLLAEVKATLTEPDWQTFIKYLDLRTTEAQQYGRPLGSDPEVDYMGARRFRRRFEL